MAYYLFNFTRANAKKGVALRTQAAELLEAGMWGIGEKTQNRDLLAPGDEIVAYVGAPERALIGQALLASPTHQWTPAEQQRYPLLGTGWVGGCVRSGFVGRIWPRT